MSAAASCWHYHHAIVTEDQAQETPLKVIEYTPDGCKIKVKEGEVKMTSDDSCGCPSRCFESTTRTATRATTLLNALKRCSTARVQHHQGEL